MEFLIMYIVTLMIMFIYALMEKQIRGNKELFFICLTIFYSFILVLRPETSKDMQAYIKVFEQVDVIFSNKITFSLFNEYMSMEYGFLILLYILKYIVGKYQIAFFLIAFFNVYVSVKYMRKIALFFNSKEVTMGYGYFLFTYSFAFGFSYSAIALRAGIAMTLSLLVVYLYLKNKWILGSIVLFLAFLIQKTIIIVAIIPLIIKFAPEVKKKTFLFINMFFIGVLILNRADIIINTILPKVIFLMEQINLGNMAISYLSVLENKVGVTDIYTGGIILFIIFLKSKKISKDNSILIWILTVAMGVLSLFYGVRAIKRVYDMFLIFYIPLTGSMFYESKRRSFERIELIVITFLLLVVELKNCFA